MARSARQRGCAAITAVLLAGGCDQTFPWSSGAPPDGPRDLAAWADAVEFDLVHLSWTPASGEDGYELEWRVGAGGWQVLNPWIGSGAAEISLAIDPATAERTQLLFRLRAVTRGQPSRWSNDALLLRGIRPPSSFAAEMGVQYTTRTGPVIVTWTNASQVATEIQLERTPLDGGGNLTTWSALPEATLEAGRYVDHLLEDGLAYAYRVRVGDAGLWSFLRQEQTPAVDLAAPWGLHAVVADDGVRLTWTNQSTTAETATVLRYTGEWPWWDLVVDLPAVPDSWVDDLPVWPAATYQVTVARPGVYLYASTELAQVEPFTLTGPPALAASARHMPEGEWVARDASGRFHVAQHVYQSPRIHRAASSGHETYVLPGAYRLAAPGVALDGQGWPHSVFLRDATGSTLTEVVHAWWNGTAWESEVVATDDVAPGGSTTEQAWFELDSAGALQVLYRRLEAFPAQDTLVHVARDRAGWAETVVTTPSVPDFARWSATFAVASDGSAYVAQIGQSVALSRSLALLCTRSSSGAWSDEIVPVGSFDFDGPWLAAGVGGNAALTFTSRFVDVDVISVMKLGGTWGAPELVTTRTPGGSSLDLAAAGSSDLSKLALSVWSGGRTDVLIRGDSGWQGVTVGPSNVLRGWLGFDASGKAWALFPMDSASLAQTMPYSFFDEMP